MHNKTFMPDGAPFELSASATEQGNTPELLAYIRELKAAGRNPRLVILDSFNALGDVRLD